MAKLNLTAERLKALDPKDMLGKTLELPGQLHHGTEIGRAFVRNNNVGRPELVEWFGLGGSAIAGDLLQAFGYEPPAVPVRIFVQRHPHRMEAGPVRLICSYSGETAEAIKAFEEVRPDQIWFTMSSGGRIERLSRQHNVPHLKLPGGYPPRAALGFMLGAMIALCEEVYDCVAWGLPGLALDEEAARYRELSPDENPALALAIQLVDRTPVIYTLDSVLMPAVANRFRAQLAENAKVWSHSAYLPELAHNEVESLPFLGQILPTPLVILLGRWKGAPVLPDPRPALTELLDNYSIAHVAVEPVKPWAIQSERLEAGLRTLLFLDVVSVYLAILRAQDPYQIPVITKLKKATTIT